MDEKNSKDVSEVLCMSVAPDKERCEKSGIEITGVGVTVLDGSSVMRINGDVTGNYDATMRMPFGWRWSIAAVVRDKEGGSLGWVESPRLELLSGAPCAPFRVDLDLGEFDMDRADRIELYPFAVRAENQD